MQKAAKAELMKSKFGLSAIRRKNDSGHHYFIANLTPNDVNARIPLTVTMKDARWFNPLNGEIYKTDINNEGILVDLKSGESMILQTYNNVLPTNDAEQIKFEGTEKQLTDKWSLSFTESAPAINSTYTLDNIQTWETLNNDTAKIMMGTGVYTTTVNMTKDEAKAKWAINLGDVRESARVYVNDNFVGCAWSVPFILDCKDAFKAGKNTLRIEVTNLPANRISEMDRQGVKWRKFDEINVVDINYKKTSYANWETVKSGLNSSVTLLKLK
jgi:hypothetical protein